MQALGSLTVMHDRCKEFGVSTCINNTRRLLVINYVYTSRRKAPKGCVWGVLSSDVPVLLHIEDLIVSMGLNVSWDLTHSPTEIIAHRLFC